jgi:hypothetical protein
MALFMFASIIGCSKTSSVSLDLMDSVPDHLKPFVKSADYTYAYRSNNDDQRNISLKLTNGVKLDIN